ncbi:hypothetical protein [uncultured Chitinophaga sp.]|jgi:hypothetical protein|uniref:hypothetical protein n=1 Tax=uncultured Chitinophaga sp. TaxID=339340 RepID=UPI002619DBA0|nr:hypothetical protein [uncultured Chitinophaga sp.]
MKKFFGFSIIATFIALSTMQVGFVSCTKENDTITVRDTIKVIDTVTVKDTIKTVDTTVTTEILTANSWKIQEIRGVTGNANVYYKRGNTANTNTQNFDNEYITFRADKTGTYVDNNGGQSSLTWDFTNAAHTTLSVTVNFPSGTIAMTWDHLCYRNKSIKYEEFYTSKGVNSHSYGLRIIK